MATALVSPAEVEKFVPQVVSQAQQLTVTSSEEYEYACTFLQFVAGRKKQVEEVFDPIVTKAHAAHKEAVAQKKKFMDPLLSSESLVKGKVSTYRMEQERIRRAEEQRLADEQRKKDEERALAEAQELEANGEKELADLVLQTAAEAPAPVVVLESSVPKQDGIASRTNWKWRFKNGEAEALRELVKAALQNEQLLGFLMVNESAVGSVVRAQKSLTKIPGIEVYPDTSVSVRAR
jgi:hypothetical protein